MSQNVQYQSPARRSKHAGSKGTLRATVRAVLARCLEPENVNFSITTREPPKRRMKETLFTRHRSTVEPLMILKDRKTTLQAIHTMAVNQAVTSLGRNVVLDDHPPAINISEKELTRK